MNLSQIEINGIKLENIDILDFFRNYTNLKEGKKFSNEYYFCAYDGQKTGSIAVNINKQLFRDFSTDIGGGIKKAYDTYFNGSKEIYIPHKEKKDETISDVEIKSIKNITNPRLIDYLKNIRKISEDYFYLLKEITYTTNSKTYYTIGWHNSKGGINTQNSYMKRVLNGVNSISFIDNKNKDKIVIFEAYFDYLAYLTHTHDLLSDVLILNGNNNIHQINLDLNTYDKIHIYNDNDKAGNDNTKLLLNNYPHAEDKRFYLEKDYNEYLIAEIEKNKTLKI